MADEVMKPAPAEAKLESSVMAAVIAGLKAARINPSDPKLAEFKKDFSDFSKGLKKDREHVEWPIPNPDKFLKGFKSALQKSGLLDEFAKRVDLKVVEGEISLTQKAVLREALPFQEPKPVMAVRKALEVAAKKMNITLPGDEIKKFLVIYKDNLEARAAKPVHYRDGLFVPLEFGKDEKKAKDFVALVNAELKKSGVKVEYLELTVKLDAPNKWIVKLGTPPTKVAEVKFG